MLKADAFGLQPFLRDYLPDGGLRSPLSMPRYPARAVGTARCLWRVFDIGACIEMHPGGMHGLVMRLSRDRFQKTGFAGVRRRQGLLFF
jgi:hypothetical protein